MPNDNTAPTTDASVETFVETVIEGYIATTECMTVKQIAEATGWSEGKVRATADKVFSGDKGWRRITPVETYVEKRDRNFGGSAGYKKARGFEPCKSYMAEMIRGMRAAKA